MVNRYNFRLVKGQHFCRDCGSMTGQGILVDKKIGEDYFVCEKHIKIGKCRKKDLYPHFRRNQIKPQDLHTKNSQNGFNSGADGSVGGK